MDNVYPVVEKRPDGSIRLAIETDVEVESEVYLTPEQANDLADKIKKLVYCN